MKLIRLGLDSAHCCRWRDSVSYTNHRCPGRRQCRAETIRYTAEMRITSAHNDLCKKLKVESCQCYQLIISEPLAEMSFILRFRQYCVQLPPSIYGMPDTRMLERQHCQSCWGPMIFLLISQMSSNPKNLMTSANHRYVSFSKTNQCAIWCPVIHSKNPHPEWHFQTFPAITRITVSSPAILGQPLVDEDVHLYLPSRPLRHLHESLDACTAQMKFV